jgi:hypothetical protein
VNLLQGEFAMASNRLIHCAIVTCLLSATVLLGGCSPPLPKTWLAPSDGAMSIDWLHAMAATSLTQR